MPTNLLNRLDWTIVGYRDGDGRCIVFGSDQLSRGEIEAVVQDERDMFFSHLSARPVEAYYRIEVETRRTHGPNDFVMYFATGDNYAEAIRNLMNIWQPQAPSAEELPSANPPERGGEMGALQ